VLDDGLILCGGHYANGDLDYDFVPGKAAGLRVIFRKTVSPEQLRVLLAAH